MKIAFWLFPLASTDTPLIGRLRLVASTEALLISEAIFIATTEAPLITKSESYQQNTYPIQLLLNRNYCQSNF